MDQVGQLLAIILIIVGIPATLVGGIVFVWKTNAHIRELRAEQNKNATELVESRRLLEVQSQANHDDALTDVLKQIVVSVSGAVDRQSATLDRISERLSSAMGTQTTHEASMQRIGDTTVKGIGNLSMQAVENHAEILEAATTLGDKVDKVPQRTWEHTTPGTIVEILEDIKTNQATHGTKIEAIDQWRATVDKAITDFATITRESEKQIMQMLRDQITVLEMKITALEAENAQLKLENAELKRQNAELSQAKPSEPPTPTDTEPPEPK